jgi:hypothetical protein
MNFVRACQVWQDILVVFGLYQERPEKGSIGDENLFARVFYFRETGRIIIGSTGQIVRLRLVLAPS